MGIGYQKRDLEIIDYQLYPLKDYQNKRTFILRGPQPEKLEKNRYFACIGAAYTFGCFCQKPYANLLQERLGMVTLNLGFAGAGPYFFLKNQQLVQYVNNAKFVIVLVMSGRSESNSLFDSGGLEMYRKRENGEQIAAELAYKQLLKNYSENYVRTIVQETRNNFVDNYKKLLEQIKVPKILLWFSQRKPDYIEKYTDVYSLFGEFPQLINLQMIDKIKNYSDDYVECVSNQGLPQLLISRFTGKHISVTGRADLGGKVRKHNNYYASPEMHIDASNVLEPICRKYLN